MLMERLAEAAAPRLARRTVTDVRMGRALVGVVLDNGQYGTAYSLPGEQEAQTAPPINLGALVGRPATHLLKGLLEPSSTLERAIGVAAVNAVAELDPAPALMREDANAAATVPIRPTDTVGFVGRIRSVLQRAEGRARRIIVFDRSLTEGVYPEERQPELLPQCDLVFITGSALTNGTLENLLRWCLWAREVVLIGPSTPLYPAVFAGSGVTVLAGAIWPPENRLAVMEQISQEAGFHTMGSLAQRWAVRVRPVE